MTTLPLILRKNGFTYTQVLREGRKAIYSQTLTGNLKYFEVFIIQSRKERLFKGKMLKGGEVFPRNESFGHTAWSFRTYAQALINSFHIFYKYYRLL